MNLQQIRYLCAVADAGSFSGGAKRAYVSQPTLSAAISDLEVELGVRLFERRKRGVVLTAEGEPVLNHARAVLREIEQLKQANAEVPRRRLLRMGVLPTIPPDFVATVLRRLQTADPDQPWVLEDASTRLLDSRLEAGRYAVILTNLGSKPAADRQRCHLMEDRQVLQIPRKVAPLGKITPRFLDNYPLIVRTHCEHLQPASRILDQWHVKPRVVARTDDDARAIALVAAGIGACLMPSSFHHDSVATIKPVGVDLRRTIGMEWKADLEFDVGAAVGKAVVQE